MFSQNMIDIQQRKKTNQDCIPIAVSKILFFNYKVGSSYVSYSNSSIIFCKTH